MFCPPGYVIVQELVEKVFERADLLDPGRLNQDEDSADQGAEAVEKIAFHAVVDFLRDRKSLSLCAPDGRVLRISTAILEYAQSRPENPDFDQLRYIGPPHWVVNTARSQDFEASALEVAALSHEDDNSNSRTCPATARYLAQFGVAEIQRQAAKTACLAAFDGWALTFEAEDLPRYWSELDAYLTEERWFGRDDDDENRSGRPGRPNKAKKALSLFDEMFPSGRGEVAWKTVAVRISERMGEPISARTIQRAVQERAKTTMD